MSNLKWFGLMLIIVFMVSCQPDYTPKPRGFFRIDLPEKSYRAIPNNYPFTFEYPVYTVLTKRVNPTGDEKYWLNIEYPKQKATIHLSYKHIDHNVATFFNDARQFVYKHTVKADAIIETPFINDSLRVYGLLYDIKGDAASNIQFYLTDSTHHFVRGALYFNVTPNKDSLAPVLEFIEVDIKHLMESFTWK